MPTRRNQVDPRSTLDLSGIEVGPPPAVHHEPGHQPIPTLIRTPTPIRTGGPVSRASINGLAGLCMLVLVLYGLGLPVPGGHLAADGVLVVVGFQLGLGVTRLAATSPHWLRRFWLSALVPVLAPTLVAIGLAVAYWWWVDRLGSTEVRGAMASIAMATNLTPLSVDAGFVATDHLWLISLVVQFALLAPLAAVFARRPDSEQTMIRAIITLVAAVTVIRLTTALTGLLAPSALAQNPFTRTDGLLLGLGVAVAPRPLIARLTPTAGALAMVTLCALMALAPDPATSPVLSLGLLVPVAAAAAAIVVATRTPAGNDPLSRFLGSLGPRWLGERAISIYVWHQLFGMALDSGVEAGVFGAEWPGFGLFATRLVFALAAGAASYRYIQQPLRIGVENLTHRGRRRRYGHRVEAANRPALSAG